MAAAWFRFLTYEVTTQFKCNRKYSLLFYKSSLKYQSSSFHKHIILNTKQQTLEQEIKEESDSDIESNALKNEDIVNLKLKILQEGLKFVPEHGWSKESIALGAKSLGLSPASHSLIHDGGADLVHYFNHLCNENLASYLEQKYLQNNEKKNSQNYIEDALENRLKMVVPFAKQWPQALSLVAEPAQIPSDLENLLDLVDKIWSLSDSNSLNGTWYSKRISLAIAYRLCEVSLIQDESPDFINSFDFLQKRVEMVLKTDQIINDAASTFQQLPDYGLGALITARNILGLNRWFK